ncbi:hypothetical protein CC1G_00155 [Coprinopsis cinerea okayama7|uniref:N-acetyltransferase domain-containing protein n=1 Tax=Coprinopsis cinerea (strain Okayama-7 / 130 / ATCC MYA-4618 / FGSC 9003) TaxID=240176 RepID=A8NWY7_COPC7|nr:hypothetical protein CC1G_00155 [Coprinopsis cinerea okayama7\|eukprot:XP_001837019.1 hypothetical protein CC1G_00155 [Coprinopsis cinerea okayama7\
MSSNGNTQFWSSLLELDDELEVTLLQDKEVWKAATTWTNAFVNDPLIRYLRDNKPLTPREAKAQKVFMSGLLLGWIRRKIAITINGGASLVVATPAPSSTGPGGPKDKFLDWLLNVTLKFSERISPRERRRRQREVRDKLRPIIDEKIAPRQNDMIHVTLVCTEPESQGRGYASALLDTITRLADILGVACWLESSNIANEPFYNSHGFKSVGNAVVGDQNPDWGEKPVIVQIMIREPIL